MVIGWDWLEPEALRFPIIGVTDFQAGLAGEGVAETIKFSVLGDATELVTPRAKVSGRIDPSVTKSLLHVRAHRLVPLTPVQDALEVAVQCQT